MDKMDPFLDNRSNKTGFTGKFETLVRKVRPLTFLVFYIGIVLIGLLSMGLAIGVSVTLYNYISPAFSDSFWRSFQIGTTLALCYFVYGISLIIIVPIINYILRLKKLVKPFRGNMYSLESMAWFCHNALLYLVRYTFLEFVTPSPLNVLFYKSMGMKIGKGVLINTTNISDACLIELGDYVTVGGSAHLLTHYAQGGYLVVSKLVIGERSTIGLKSTVFGNVTIGKSCTVKPHSVVLPKTTLSDNQIV